MGVGNGNKNKNGRFFQKARTFVPTFDDFAVDSTSPINKWTLVVGSTVIECYEAYPCKRYFDLSWLGI